ncbi:hypothetical protein FQA39_LY09411 [Lamprigera yunnana]|nr:hypothetical protein FQA39_LY09411 [Lamprigera yunnana]
MMLVIVCAFYFVLAVQSAPRGTHSSILPEKQCLLERDYLNLTGVHNEVQGKGVSTPERAEPIGSYLMCVWKKRHIVDDMLKINSANIADYFYDTYFTMNLSQNEKEEIKVALKVCENERADKEYELGIKIKDCMFSVAESLEFLKRKSEG